MKKNAEWITVALLSVTAVVLGIMLYKTLERNSAVHKPAAETVQPVNEEPEETGEAEEIEKIIELSPETEYNSACEKFEAGEYSEAEAVFAELGDYEDSAAKLQECREKLYDLACEKLYRCEFEAAAEEFEHLGSTKNSENYLAYCRERIEIAANPPERSILNAGFVSETYDDAKMYFLNGVMLYVPDECDENTAFFVFYPGGVGAEVYLPFQKVYEYVENEHPNAVMYFCTTSGYTTYRGRNRDVIENLKQIAVEKNIVVHNLVVCGASAGVYTAIHAAADYYSFAGIPTWKVIALDAAQEWEDPQKLSDEDLDIISKNGTKMFLFEQPGVRDEKEQIRDMIEHDCYVTIVECAEKLHNFIAYHAFKYGVFSYALEMCDESGLHEGEYTFVNLNGE